MCGPEDEGITDDGMMEFTDKDGFTTDETPVADSTPEPTEPEIADTDDLFNSIFGEDVTSTDETIPEQTESYNASETVEPVSTEETFEDDFNFDDIEFNFDDILNDPVKEDNIADTVEITNIAYKEAAEECGIEIDENEYANDFDFFDDDLLNNTRNNNNDNADF